MSDTPRFYIDVVVSAELAALYEVWLGRITFSQAMHDQRLELDAAPALIRTFPKWFALSPVARMVRAATAAGSKDLSDAADPAAPDQRMPPA